MPDIKQRIMLVEDDSEVAEIVKDYLQEANYSVELCHSGANVVEQVRTSPPLLILLDIMLPEVDGITICKEVRAFSDLPIIMLTAKVDEVDRLLGYDIGADDYICKPVKPREILARINAVLRRAKLLPIDEAPELKLDESRMLVIYKGQRLDLTLMEFKLLKLLYSGGGKIFSRQQIKKRIYDAPDDASDRAVDTCVKKLRSKFSKVSDDDGPIRSIYGVGYSYEAKAE